MGAESQVLIRQSHSHARLVKALNIADPMTNPSNEKPTVEQVLKLIEQLSSEQRVELLQKLKIEDFRCEIQLGIDAADHGEIKPAEEVFARLRTKAESRLQEGNTPRKSVKGLWKEFGSHITEEDIAEVRAEMWHDDDTFMP